MPNQHQQGIGSMSQRDQQLGKQAMGDKHNRRPDRGMVGRDTDGDGKVVKPGQKPGQSHGTGVIDK